MDVISGFDVNLKPLCIYFLSLNVVLVKVDFVSNISNH